MNMNDIIVNLFVIFAVSASAELTPGYATSGGRQAPYEPSGWRPSGPEFRYPSLTTQSSVDLRSQDVYLPPARPESRAFAQASLNIQLPPLEGRQPFEERQLNPEQRSRVPDPSFTGFKSEPSSPGQQSSYSPPPSGDAASPSRQRSSNSDQFSYLPPSLSQYRSQQQGYLTPPQEFRAIPYSEYGPPPQQFGAPSPPQEYGPPSPPQEYGPPTTEATTSEQPTTTEALETTTTELPEVIDARTEALSENAVDAGERSQKLTQNEEQGIYYIYHPSGQLQRIRYTTNDDQEGMVYSAKLRYENVEPINGPIYTYNPETYVFSRIN